MRVGLRPEAVILRHAGIRGLSAAGRGDGLVVCAAGRGLQRGSVVRGRFTGVIRGGGLVACAADRGLPRGSVVRGRFTGASRGDGLVACAAGCGRQRGFSLIEILLVMALIAAMGVLAAGVLTGGFDRMALRSSAREVAAQLRFARAHAIATGVPQTFAIDPAARAWQGANGRSGELPRQLGVYFTGAREVQPVAGVGAIMFFGDGASTGGRVQLRLRDAAWNIDVAWLTGEVTLGRGEVPQ